MTSPRWFVIIASQRTGSTLLIRSLDGSPDVFCAGELFHAGPGIHHPEFQFPYRLLGSQSLARARDRLSPKSRVEDHLKTFFVRAGKEVSAVGFKLMTTHVDSHPAVMPFLSTCGVHFFFLCRLDSFATALSYYKARESGVYHSDRLNRRTTGPELVADVKAFGRLLDACRADKERVLAMHSQFGGRLLTYEEMTNSWDDFISTVGADIGLPALSVEKSLSRMDSGTLPLRISNEEELRDKFI